MNKRIVRIASLLAALSIIIGIASVAKVKFDKRELEKSLTGTVCYVDYTYDNNLSRIVKRNLSDNSETVVYESEKYISDCYYDKESDSFTVVTMEEWFSSSKKAFILTFSGNTKEVDVPEDLKADYIGESNNVIATNDNFAVWHSWDNYWDHDKILTLTDIKSQSVKSSVKEKGLISSLVLNQNSSKILYGVVEGRNLCSGYMNASTFKIYDFESGITLKYKADNGIKIVKLVDWTE